MMKMEKKSWIDLDSSAAKVQTMDQRLNNTDEKGKPRMKGKITGSVWLKLWALRDHL